MREMLIRCLLVIFVIMACIIIILGLQNGNFGLESYIKLQQRTENLNEEVQKLQAKNTSVYEAKKQDLVVASEKYWEQKRLYEQLTLEMESVGNNSNKPFVLYDMDFLWTIIGNYATEEGIILQFDVSNMSNEILFLESEYILCNLDFNVTGEYASIVRFIYDLEDDERLKFEIRDFSLNKIGENLQATFFIKSVPINQTNLSNLKETDKIDMEKNTKENMNQNMININTATQ